MVDFFCQIKISLLDIKKLFKVLVLFKNSRIQGFNRFFKHKLPNSKLFRDSSFLATLIVHAYIFTINIIKISNFAAATLKI